MISYNFEEVLNESKMICEGLFNKKNKTVKKKDDRGADLLNKYNNATNEKMDKNKLIANIKNIETKLYSDNKYLLYVENLSRKAMEQFNLSESDFSPSINGHKLVPKLVSQDEGDDYIVIIDHTQFVRVGLSVVLDDIIKELNKMREYKDISFDTGDGDEGCIYW